MSLLKQHQHKGEQRYRQFGNVVVLMLSGLYCCWPKRKGFSHLKSLRWEIAN